MSRLDKFKILAELIKALILLDATVGIGIGADIWTNIKKQQYDIYLMLEFIGFLLSVFINIFFIGIYIEIAKDSEGEK